MRLAIFSYFLFTTTAVFVSALPKRGVEEDKHAITFDKRANDYYIQGVEYMLVLATAQRIVLRWLWDAAQGEFFNNGFDGSNVFQLTPIDNGPTSDQLVIRGGTTAQDRRTGITITSNANVVVGEATLLSGSQPGPQPTPFSLVAGTTNVNVLDGLPVTIRDTNQNAIRVMSGTFTVTAMHHEQLDNPPSPPSDEL